MNKDYIAPWIRVAILIIATVSILSMSYFFTGSVIPSDAGDALIFQNALLLVVIGVALLEKYYTKPADSMVNSLMGIITLIGVFNIMPKLTWWVMASYVILVFLLSIITTSIYSFDVKNSTLIKLADATYQPAVLLSQAKVIYSILFLFALFSFKGIQSPQTVALVLF